MRAEILLADAGPLDREEVGITAEREIEREMFIYADESGNTGRNIFDAQDIYRLGAILSVPDIEAAADTVISPVLQKIGKPRLHANELGEAIIADVCAKLIAIFDKLGKWQFNLTVIHKPYIATTKFVDTIFDSSENIAVPPMWYNLEIFRHGLCCAMDDVLTHRNKELFWRAYLADDMAGIQACIRNAATYLDRYIHDARTKVVVRDAFRFALRNPEQFTLSAAVSRKAYQGHTPNMVAFSTLVAGTHEFAEANNSKPIAIIHDEQQEFASSMKEFMTLFGRVKKTDEPMGGIPAVQIVDYDMPNLVMPSSRDKKALQAVDALLWILQREPRLEVAKAVKELIVGRSNDFHISRGMSELIVAARGQQMSDMPLPYGQMSKAKRIQIDLEERRISRVNEFEAEKRRSSQT